MFGATLPPQNENTCFHPCSPYGCSKVFAFNITKLYREAYGIFAVNGILFNHESPRRGETFVTRKITRGIARIKAGLDKKIYLGNLEAKRDWGYAPEYMEAAYLMIQQKPLMISSSAPGESHSIREFLEVAFKEAGLGDYHKYVSIDKRYYRPAEVDNLIADISKAKKILGWKPKTTFEALVKIMVKADLKNELKNKKIFGHGRSRFLGKFVVQELIKKGVPEKNIKITTKEKCDLTKWENCIKSGTRTGYYNPL